VFAKTSRRNTPWVGNLMVIVGGGGLTLIAAYSHTMDRFIPIAGTREFSAFLVSATAGSFAIELVYLALAAAAIALLVRYGGVWWQYVVVLVAVATPVLGFYGALHPGPHNSTNLNWLAMYWALGVVVLLAVWYAVMQVWKPDRIRNAAAHAAEHHGVAPLDENVDFTPAPPDTAI
jgi:hypothetical protein